LLSLEFTKSLAYPNLYLHCDGTLMLLYVDDISMWLLAVAFIAAIDVQARLSVKSKITNHRPARQVLGIEIHLKEYGTSTGSYTRINLGQIDFITTISR
jgi:hypothetical protein